MTGGKSNVATNDNSKTGGGGQKKKRSSLGRGFQAMMETFGNREKTELSGEFADHLSHIEEHKVFVQLLKHSSQKVVQPDTKCREKNEMPQEVTPYDLLVVALVKAQKDTMSQPPESALVLGHAAYAYSVMAEKLRDFQVAGAAEVDSYRRFETQYLAEIAKERAELEKRRMDMDESKANLKSASDSRRLRELGETYDEDTKAFEDQAETLFELLEQLPTKKENHRRAMRNLMQAELAWHKAATSQLETALQNMKLASNSPLPSEVKPEGTKAVSPTGATAGGHQPSKSTATADKPNQAFKVATTKHK